MAGRIAVVDEQNRFVRWEERRTIHEQRLVHRSIHVLVFDSAGRLIIQRRHRDKQTHPRYWDGSCAGHVEESDYPAGPDERLDEVYHETAVRELEQELGVRAPLEPLGSFGPVAGLHYEQIRLYRARSDGPFTPQVEEVEELARVLPHELDALIAGPELVTPLLAWWGQWLRERGEWPGA